MPRTVPLWVVGFVLAQGGPAALAAEPTAREQASALEAHMQKVIEDATPSVVSLIISTAKYADAAEKRVPGQLGEYTPKVVARPFQQPFLPVPIDPLDLANAANAANNQFGSGIVLDASQGLILTNYHLIEGATKIYARTSTGKGSYADIHAADARCDLAVLRLIQRPAGMTSAVLGKARLVAAPDGTKPNLKKGSWVIALGHAQAAGVVDGSPTASWGILGNIRRRSPQTPVKDELRSRPLYQYGSLLQTDARVVLGSSGSALLNMEGEVIGIASAVAAVSGSEVSGGFALPMDANYRRIVDVLKKGEEVEYGFLGVSMSNNTSDRGGVVIGSITPGCPAQLAGLRDGDIIKAVDGHNLTESDDLLLHVGGALAGTTVTLTVMSGTGSTAREFQVDVVLAKSKPENPQGSIASVRPPSFHGLRVDYSSVRLVELFQAQLPLRALPPVGVVVRDIEINSAAEKRFKEAGDAARNWFITRVDNTAVAKPADFYKAVTGKSSVKLTLADPAAPNRTLTIMLP